MSLVNIPSDVFESNLFPLLSVPELLKLRRVCRFTKALSEEYLRIHPRPKNQISLSPYPEGQESTLDTFLRENDLCTIRKPTSTIRLNVSVLNHPQIDKFLSHYGNQIKHVVITELTLPLEESELHFYDKLSKLKSLTVTFAKLRHCEVSNPLPKSFQELKHLKIRNLEKTKTIEQANHLWKMFEFCSNLRSFGCPCVTDVHFQKFQQILRKGQHKKFQIYDVEGFADCKKISLISDLYELSLNCNVKLVNIVCKLVCSFDKLQLQQIAKNIVSIRKLIFLDYLDDLVDVTLPNLEKIEFCFLIEDDEESHLYFLDEEYNGQVGVMTRVLRGSVTFSNLRKLEIWFPRYAETSGKLALMWAYLPSLEELIFLESCGESVEDVAFIGEDGTLPFLHLTKLRKLDLGVVDRRPCSSEALSDISFSQVFRNMRLREFHLASDRPLTRITQAGIRSLLTGQFGETIDVFPFQEWSIKNMTKKNFRRLAAEFRCNMND